MRSLPADWRLSVSDNGIGRQDLHERAHPGLGTSIIRGPRAPALRPRRGVERTAGDHGVDHSRGARECARGRYGAGLYRTEIGVARSGYFTAISAS